MRGEKARSDLPIVSAGLGYAGRATRGTGSGRERKANEDRIFIPMEARNRPLIEFDLSTRLSRVLQYFGVQNLGDLDGRCYSEIFAYRNCGAKTMAELKRTVLQVQPSSTEAPCPPPPTPGEVRIAIPNALRGTRLADLPLSCRLETVLTRNGVARLGDLHGSTLSHWLMVGRCGPQTFKELVALLARVRTGEFLWAPVKFSPALFAGLARRLEELIDQLRDRERRVLLLCLGGEAEPPPTCAKIGSIFRVSYQRILNIKRQSLGKIRREGGPRLAGQMRVVAKEAASTGIPLNPERIKLWMAEAGVVLRYPPIVCLRAVHELDPDFCAQ